MSNNTQKTPENDLLLEPMSDQRLRDLTIEFDQFLKYLNEVGEAALRKLRSHLVPPGAENKV
jgi:hypothetical protein